MNTYTHENVEALKEALFGRSVVAVRPGTGEAIEPYGPAIEGEVELDDGRVLKLAGNGPDCICSAGDYQLTQLNAMPINGITNVEVVVDADPECGDSLTYRIFVLAQDRRFELATFEGDDDNGYYGTGFWFTVQEPE